MPRSTRSLILAFGLCARGLAATEGADAWTRSDTLWEVSYAAVVLMDCAQSCQMKDLHRSERNPVLPRHPNARNMCGICAGSIACHVLVANLLPATWRRPFQMATVFLEAGVVADNYFRAGVSIKF